MDVDLVVALQRENILRAFRALTSLGYRPTVPVTAEGFADERQRESWRREKGMQVLNFVSEQHRSMPIDVFVVEPFDFVAEYARALVVTIAAGVTARIVSLETLIAMKSAVGRARDLDDVEHLRLILKEQGSA